MKIVILEPGAWGTALGIILSKKGDETKVSSSPTEPRRGEGQDERSSSPFTNARVNKVSFWYESEELASKISRLRKNERLPGIKISSKILVSSQLEKLTEKADLIVIASPSFGFRQILLKMKKLRKLAPLLGIAKGMEKETLKFPSQIVKEVLGNHPYSHLSGPGFASEVARGKKTKEVIAASNTSLLKKLKAIFQIRPFQISTTTDLIGLQLAGAAKNALAIGISFSQAALPNPDNKAIRKSLINIGLKEMIKLGQAMGAKKKTFLGPAGLDDLILTATSPLSRNFQFGRNFFLNPDKIRKEIVDKKLTVEGFNNVYGLYQLGKIYKVDLAMINEIYKLIYKRISPFKIAENLIDLVKK